jgi:hypothetical protein
VLIWGYQMYRHQILHLLKRVLRLCMMLSVVLAIVHSLLINASTQTESNGPTNSILISYGKNYTVPVVPKVTYTRYLLTCGQSRWNSEGSTARLLVRSSVIKRLQLLTNPWIGQNMTLKVKKTIETL